MAFNILKQVCLSSLSSSSHKWHARKSSPFLCLSKLKNWASFCHWSWAWEYAGPLLQSCQLCPPLECRCRESDVSLYGLAWPLGHKDPQGLPSDWTFSWDYFWVECKWLVCWRIFSALITQIAGSAGRRQVSMGVKHFGSFWNVMVTTILVGCCMMTLALSSCCFCVCIMRFIKVFGVAEAAETVVWIDSDLSQKSYLDSLTRVSITRYRSQGENVLSLI